MWRQHNPWPWGRHFHFHHPQSGMADMVQELKQIEDFKLLKVTEKSNMESQVARIILALDLRVFHLFKVQWKRIWFYYMTSQKLELTHIFKDVFKQQNSSARVNFIMRGMLNYVKQHEQVSCTAKINIRIMYQNSARFLYEQNPNETHFSKLSNAQASSLSGISIQNLFILETIQLVTRTTVKQRATPSTNITTFTALWHFHEDHTDNETTTNFN